MMPFRQNSESQTPLSSKARTSTDNQQPWEELLEKIALGDKTALSALYQDSSSLVFSLILRIVMNRKIAEELLLDTFKQVWQQAALYEKKSGEPLAWLLAIARTRALACLRSGKCGEDSNSFSRPSLGAVKTPTEKPAFIVQRQKLARLALTSLSSIQREMIELAYYEGLTTDEIAYRLELPFDVVKQQIIVAMNKLREVFTPVPQEKL